MHSIAAMPRLFEILVRVVSLIMTSSDTYELDRTVRVIQEHKGDVPTDG